jgi:dihydroneopterin aldolase
MTTSRLFLSGIRASGHHGARAGEKDDPQDFVVDLDLEVDIGEDSIEVTADYRRMVDAVREVITDGSYDLIEAMAHDVAERVLAFDHVTSVSAVVHKPNAARRLEIDGVAAAVTLPAPREA